MSRSRIIIFLWLWMSFAWCVELSVKGACHKGLCRRHVDPYPRLQRQTRLTLRGLPHGRRERLVCVVIIVTWGPQTPSSSGPAVCCSSLLWLNSSVATPNLKDSPHAAPGVRKQGQKKRWRKTKYLSTQHAAGWAAKVLTRFYDKYVLFTIQSRAGSNTCSTNAALNGLSGVQLEASQLNAHIRQRFKQKEGFLSGHSESAF